MLSSEIGGGFIRDDVQQAIRRELDYRLGEGDARSALSRRDKELILLSLNVSRPNACLSQLHARAAVKAGATAEQVRDGCLSAILLGMLRWKMAGQGSLGAAEEVLGVSRVTNAASKEDKQKAQDARVNEVRRYVRQVLNVEFPDMFEKLASVAPDVLIGYMTMRQSIVPPDPLGSLPKKTVELMIIAIDILQQNSWGAELHARQAVRDGVTVPEVVEAVALAVIECGVPAFKTGGLEAIEAAEKVAAEGAG